MKLAYQATLRWASYHPFPRVLPTSIHGYIMQIFENLEKVYGYELVSKAFSYRVCCRQGESPPPLSFILRDAPPRPFFLPTGIAALPSSSGTGST